MVILELLTRKQLVRILVGWLRHVICLVDIYLVVGPVLLSIVVTYKLLGVDKFGCIHWIYFQHTLLEHLAMQSVVVRTVNCLHAYTMVVQTNDVCRCGVCLVSRPYFLVLGAMVRQKLLSLLALLPRKNALPLSVIVVFSQCHWQYLLLSCSRSLLALVVVDGPFRAGLISLSFLFCN